jgi:hypothetical protein
MGYSILWSLANIFAPRAKREAKVGWGSWVWINGLQALSVAAVLWVIRSVWFQDASPLAFFWILAFLYLGFLVWDIWKQLDELQTTEDQLPADPGWRVAVFWWLLTLVYAGFVAWRTNIELQVVDSGGLLP